MSNAEAIRTLRQSGKHDEARELAVQLLAQVSGDAELEYEAASVHDYLGREAEAVPYYLAAISGDLPPELLRSAFLGLGSTYRALGQYDSAVHTLREGLMKFPDASEIKTFLAMALHNLGDSKQAVELLLVLLAESSNDKHIQSYREAIMFYARDIEKSWP